ncbi:hypothetical protein HZB97_01325, partial [Candidatus Gottesmanbacteria bacterium]|nr:hypothetical protein [Candidatus Gottesmanbacteria bacterium]
KGDFGNFVRGLSLVYVLTFIYLFFFKKNLRKVLVVVFSLLGISSLRYIEPSAPFYNAFHAFPWFGLILAITIWQIGQIWQDQGLKRVGIILVISYLGFLGRFFVNDYYRVTDRERDWYVNFSRFYDYGETMKRLSKPGDKIIVFPVEQLLYWQSGLGHATRFLYGYEWLFVNQKYRAEIKNELEKSPPAFIYYDRQSMGKDAWSIFDKYVDSYTRIKQGDFETPLFVRKDRLNL